MSLARQLDADLFWLQNDAVIAAAGSSLAESATKTILIVDDDRSVADTFARMLKLEGTQEVEWRFAADENG